MSASYRLTRLAEADLLEIRRHIAADDAAAADRLIDRLGRGFLLLARQPGIGVAREDLRPDLRQLPVGNYSIFYRCTDGAITIVRVLHGARDHPAIFEAGGSGG